MFVYIAHTVLPEMIVCMRMQWSILEPLSTVTDRLQASKVVTGSLVLPLISKLAAVVAPDHKAVDFMGQEQTFSPEMMEVRTKLHDDLCRRYQIDLPEDKLEDHIIAMMCDPR